MKTTIELPALGAAVRTPSGRAGVVIPRPPDTHLDSPSEARDCRVWVRVTLDPPRWAGGDCEPKVLEIEACYDGRDLEVIA